MRKLVLTLFAAALAVIFIPGSPASAAISTGHTAGCYSVRGTHRYNNVEIGVTPHHGSGKNVYIYAYITVSKRCAAANTIPVSRITLYNVRLKDRATGKVIRMAGGGSTTKASTVSARTSNKYMSCGHGFIPSAKVSYAYTNGTHVRPFYVSGGAFKRC